MESYKLIQRASRQIYDRWKLSIAESTKEWAVEDLEMKGNAAIPKFAAAALTRAPRLKRLKWDCCRSVGEESTVWHDLGLSR